MRYKSLIFLLSALFMAIGATADARNSSHKNTSSNRAEPRKEMKVSTEFGLGVGAQYNWLECERGYDDISLKYGFSGGATLQFRLNIGKHLAIQPEVKYSYGTIKVNYPKGDFSTKAKFSLVQVPVLFSFNISALRFNFGPVFSLMDNPEYMFKNEDGSYEKYYLGKIYPTVTYAASVGVKFAKAFLIDVRYTGQFKEKRETNELIYSAGQSAIPFKTRIHGIQIHFGYAF